MRYLLLPVPCLLACALAAADPATGAAVRPAAARLVLTTAPAGSAGVVLRLNAEAPPATVVVAASGRRFRHVVRSTLQRPWPADGVLTLRWDEFQAAADEDGALPASGMESIEVTDAAGRVAVAATVEALVPGAVESPAWAGLPAVAGAPDAEGWRPGIPSWGFGRFGWRPFNGMLCGEARDWRLTAECCDDHGKRQQLKYAVRPGAAGGELQILRRQVDWTGVDLVTQLKPAAAAGEARAGHAFGADDGRLRVCTLTTSILVPGVLVDCAESELALVRPEPDAPAPRLAGVDAGGQVRWLEPGAPALGEGWLLVVWPDSPALPLLIAPQHRPSAIEVAAGTVTLRFAGPAGKVGIGQPSGWRPAPAGEDAPAALAPACRRLAAQLRAYPRSARQSFRLAGQAVEVRERFTHQLWDNDWAEVAEPVAPAPPQASFAADQGYGVGWPAGAPADLGPSTRYGPWRGWRGHEACWSLPVPDHRQELHLRPLGDPLVAALAERLVEPRSQPKRNTGLVRPEDALSGFWLNTPAALAITLLDPEPRRLFLERWREALDKALDPAVWHLRREPFSGAAYPVSFAWRERSSDTLGDVNSGLGGMLTAAALYARTSGDWAWAGRNWPAIDGMLRYFLVQHDWTHMQGPAREHSGSSAIDMDVISTAGVAGYVALADGLGRADDAALGRLLLARLGLSLGFRWAGLRWERPGQPMEQWPGVTHGFAEYRGWDYLGFDWGPDHVHGELALGLSWMGNYAPVYRQHLRALGPDFWRWWEYEAVGKRLADWRSDHKGNRNNHPANVCSNLYLRAMLGASTEELRGELERQPWGLKPGGESAKENAGFYALLLGRAAPLRLIDWGRAEPLSATWDSGTATLDFITGSPEVVTLQLDRAPVGATLDGQAIAIPLAGEQLVALPAGSHRLVLRFAL
jgi:hypothetical protein